MQEKIEGFRRRFHQLEHFLSQGDSFEDPKKYRDSVKEHADLGAILEAADRLSRLKLGEEEARQLLDQEQNEEMKQLLNEEISSLGQQISEALASLELLLVPPDPTDDCNVIMELRAGTGGDEAALFVGDCVRMYQLYAASKGWKWEPLSSHPAELGGFKEYIMALSGKAVKRLLQYEGGTHRVQRVPKTEAQGRVHTSAITIAIMPEPMEEEDIDIQEKDLRIDTYRSSGAGGQHVNTTDSAVRITHLPTGVVTYCSDERSQHKNKAKAMRLLKAKIAESEREKRRQSESKTRALQVGSGDRSERIRTYNFSQNRVTDHRINLTLYCLDKVMEGDLDGVTTALVKYFYEQQLLG